MSLILWNVQVLIVFETGAVCKQNRFFETLKTTESFKNLNQSYHRISSTPRLKINKCEHYNNSFSKVIDFATCVQHKAYPIKLQIAVNVIVNIACACGCIQIWFALVFQKPLLSTITLLIRYVFIPVEIMMRSLNWQVVLKICTWKIHYQFS